MKLKLAMEKVNQINHSETGKRVREMREKKQMSLRILAHLMDVSPPFLSDLELGRRNWTMERFDLASRILTGGFGE